MTSPENKEFEIRGINHLALVCRDMAKTVDFYSNVLGMPLIRTLDLPAGSGQHFFFDIGNGDSLAFFWFPNAPDAAPEVPTLERVEWEHIQRVLADCGGNITRAARALGLHRRSLQRKLAARPRPR